MRTVLVLWVMLGATASALAQGTVLFNNRLVGSVITHVYLPSPVDPALVQDGNGSADFPPGTTDWTGWTPVDGSGFSAQLFAALGAGVPAGLLQPGYPITTFRTGLAAGFVQGVTATLTGVPYYSAVAIVQMRVWDNRGGTIPDWDTVMAQPPEALELVGISSPINVDHFYGVLDSASLIGLQSFNLSAAQRMVIGANYTNVATGFQISFGGLSTFPMLQSVWDFGDGTQVTNQLAPVHAWWVPGIYTVRLTGYPSNSTSTVSTSLKVTVSDAQYYVDAAGTNPVLPYSTWQTAATNIQDAINVGTLPGRQVWVTNGAYGPGATNSIGANSVALVDPVVVQSVNGPKSTVIEGDTNGIRCAVVGIRAILSGFTLRNGAALGYFDGYGGGVLADTLGVVSNCVITGNSASSYGGGGFGGSFYNCQFIGNAAASGGGVAYCAVKNSQVTGNSASSDGGGALGGWLFNCTLTDNSADGSAGGVSSATLLNCIVYFNKAPHDTNYTGSTFEYCCTTPLPSGPGNLADDPQLVDAVHLSPSSPCLRAGNPADATGVDIDGEPWAAPPAIGADQPGPTATVPSLSIQASYTNAAPDYAVAFSSLNISPMLESVWDFGDGTIVTNQPFLTHAFSAPGVYTVRLTGYSDANPTGASAVIVVTINQDTYYVDAAGVNPIFPYAGWQTAATNIQDAISAGSLPGRLVLVTNGLYQAGSILLSGTNRVALTNAVVVRSVNGPQQTVLKGQTNGVRCAWVGNGAILDGFTLTSGSSSLGGGGAWCQTWGVLSNCVITGNSAPGYGYGGGAYGGILYKCTLAENSAYGGGGSAASTVHDCLFTNNSALGGGGSANCVLYNCTLSGNSAWGGGGANAGALYNCVLTTNTAGKDGGGANSAALYNCALSDNVALDGGGATYAQLYNCTVTGNSASSYGGGVAQSSLYNCIIYFNQAPQASNYAGGTLQYCCTTPLPSGPGNIALDPQLAGGAHLSPGSPCIGAGNAAYAQGVDIDGEPWANPPAIGADQPGPATGPLTMGIQANYTNAAPGYAVSFSAYNTGPILQSVWDFGDGTMATNQPFPAHAWSVPGVYTVRLTGYNDSNPAGVVASIVITVSEVVYYVDAANPNPSFPFNSWQTAAISIQDAIGADDLPGRLVLVTNGLYRTGAIQWDGTNRVALTNPVVVRSVNGPQVTVIEGYARRVRCAWVGNEASLSGFTLKHGGAPGEYGPANGGGVFAEPLATLTNCVLTVNSAGSSGGGAYGGTLYNCTLAGNAAYDGGGAWGSTLINCLLTGNSAGNTGGGAVGGSLYNCLLATNSAFEGGAAVGSSLFNCTVVGNSGTNYGGGVLNTWLRNSISCFNRAPQYTNYSGDMIEYSCTTPLPVNGVSNLSADPRFVNPKAGDFRLLPDSPCIDAGTNSPELLTTDFQGLPRVMDGDYNGIARVDMGSYEFNPYHFEPVLELNSNGFQFTIRGEPGKLVRIEVSRDLLNWEFMATIPIPASGQTMIDPAATTESFRFYRAIALR